MTLSAANRLKPGSDTDGSFPGPGPQLRDARRAKKMSIEEAARRMKLEVSILEALERDDYADIPAPLYVRGYLTGYARLLDFPEQEVLESFRRAQGESASPVISAETSLGRQARSSDRGVRWFSYLFGVAILAVATYWGYERWLEDRWVSMAPVTSAGNTDEAIETSPVEADAESQEQREQRVPLQEAANDAATGAPLPETPALASAGQARPKARDAGDQQPLGIGGPDPLAADDADVPSASNTSGGGVSEFGLPRFDGDAATAVETDGMSGDLPSNAIATAPDPTAEPAAGSDRLELAFNRDCWLEIRDAAGERLAFGLAKSGSVRRYVGQAPFRITLGDSGGVSILYNGRLVKPESYRAAEGRPARLTLGDADSPA